jgi:hypothetical protein
MSVIGREADMTRTSGDSLMDTSPKSLLVLAFAIEILASIVINTTSFSLGLALVVVGGILGVVVKSQTNDVVLSANAIWAIGNAVFGVVLSVFAPSPIVATIYWAVAIWGLYRTYNGKPMVGSG